jgi:hypothetical protein
MKPKAGKAYFVHFGGLSIEKPGHRPVLIEGPVPFGSGVRLVYVDRVGYKWTRIVCPHTLRGAQVNSKTFEHLLDAVQSCEVIDLAYTAQVMEAKRVQLDAIRARIDRENKVVAGFNPDAIISLPYVPPQYVRAAIMRALEDVECKDRSAN